MKIFIDTLDLQEIKRYAGLGILSGVTTNPTLAKRFGMTDDIDMVTQIREALPTGEIHVEAFGNTSENIIDNIKRIHTQSRDDNLVFKIPFSIEGIKAINVAKQSLRVKTNLHLIFSTNQALISSNVKSDYICPLVGRLDDAGHDAFENLEKFICAFSHTSDNITKIMISSVRHPQHVEKAFIVGADSITIPPYVLDKLFTHPLTDVGYEQFKSDIISMSKN